MDLYPQAGGSAPLLIKHLLDRPLAWSPEQKIIYRDLREFSYRDLHQRVGRLASLLHHLHIGPGDRVGVMDWDSHRYLEFFFAVPMVGAVLHTINVRLAPEQILYTVRHAEDRVLFFHPDFLPWVESCAQRCPSIRHRVILPDSEEPPATSLQLAGDYERLLQEAAPVDSFPDFDENTPATLFYTTGTTGDPKGVFFTHRQLVLHTLTAGLALSAFPDPTPIHCHDVYMPLTPMFHVHAWGVPYIATLLGIRQVYPGRYEPGVILRLLTRHKVTLSHCVPTLLKMLLNAPEAAQVDFSSWKVITGGAKLPLALARQAMERGIRIAQGYGLSETCPIIGISHFKTTMDQASLESRLDILNRTAFPIPLVRAAAMDATGQPLPPGPEGVGELVLQAPWLTAGYFKEPQRSSALWEHGWMHTGDLAYLDADGYIRITDRIKDVIKTGGEWISSLDLESVLAKHETIEEVAVVGVPDPKWDERPLAFVRLRPSHQGQVCERDLQRFLRDQAEAGNLHKRAVLTQIRFVDQLPHTSVGKIDKRALRSLSQPNCPPQP